MLNGGVWSFAVVAAIVTTAGTLFGHYLKEVVLARSLEDWKHRRALREIYRRYRDPIVLAGIELANRLKEITEEYPTDFLDACLLEGMAPLPSLDSIRNTYFQRYKCQSTIYRLAGFLGWLELFRQELVFLDPEGSKAIELLEPLSI